MSMDRALLDIVCCPLTQAPLERLSEAAIERLNRKIRDGSVKNQAGELVAEPFEEALVTRDGKLAYPVRDGVPILLVEQGIRLEQGE